MSNQRSGYIRVSTLTKARSGSSTESRLIRYLLTRHPERIQTGQLHVALNHVRTGDTLVVHSMDRLARNVEDMLRLVREMNDRCISSIH